MAVLGPPGWPIVWIVAAIVALVATGGGAAPPLARPLLASALTLEASFAAISIASDLRYHLWPMMAVALALVLLAGARWRRGVVLAGGVELAMVLAIAIVARATLPLPPQSYQGMLG
jgi:hypothetical protein